jgi:uncharacterized membrane protein
MSKEHKRDALFYRSFHLSFGGLLLILPALIWIAQGHQSGSWPLFAWVLFFCLPVFGIAFLIFGIVASNEKIGSIRIVATSSSIFMAILAVPLYLVLRSIRRKKRQQSMHKKT